MVPVTKLPSHLPDLCLENIFKRVPLRDLIRSVRVVCTNWNRVVPNHLRVHRELVVLFRDYNEDVEPLRKKRTHRFEIDLIEHVHREDGSPWVQLRPLDPIRFNALLLPGDVLTEAFTSPLLDTVPAITHLTVVQEDIYSSSVISVLVQLVRLLNHYRHRLISLKLDLSIYSKRVDLVELVANCTSLLDSINQLAHLRHLTLSISFEKGTYDTRYGPTVFSQLPRLSILSRLDTFTSNYDATWLMDSIRLHATGRVRIDCTPRLSMKAFNALDQQQLTSKLTSLIIKKSLRVTHYDNIRLLGARFIFISRLALFVHSMPMTMLARCLSPLAQLVNLKIVYEETIPKDEEPEPEYVQVASVRLLSLIFKTKSHLDTEKLHLSQIFPNLQVLSLYQDFACCDECHIVALRTMPRYQALRDQVAQCIRLTREPFRLCAQLHTIKHQGISFHSLQDPFPRDLITRDQF